MQILSYQEEEKLSKKELLIYYEKVREYLLHTSHEGLTKGSLTICNTINPIVRNILKKFCGYEIIAKGNESIKGLNGIYAYTHQSKLDHVNFIATNPNHTILLNSSILSPLYTQILKINGVVYMNKAIKKERESAKCEMIRLLLQEKPVTIFPESTWNCSLNKLHLPMRKGIIDIAKISQKPIIPVVLEYTYNEDKNDGIEHINNIHAIYCDPIFVKEEDNSFDKLDQFSEVIATVRWNLIQEKGIFKRESFTDQHYVNYMKGNIRNLKNAGIDIDVENEGIWGAKDDFYLFHYINNIPFDEKGHLLQETEHVKKLVKLYNNHYSK